MDENFNNNIPEQNPAPQQPQQPVQPEQPQTYADQYAQTNQTPDYSSQYAQYNQPRSGFEQQPVQPQQPDYNRYQQPQQPDYNQYQQPQQPDYTNQYTSPYQDTPVQPYDYNQQGYQQPIVEQPAGQITGAAKAFSIVGLICGIVSMVACCYGFIFGIPGLVFSILAKKKTAGLSNKQAQLGLIFSIIGLVLSVIWAIVFIAAGVFSRSYSYYSYY